MLNFTSFQSLSISWFQFFFLAFVDYGEKESVNFSLFFKSRGLEVRPSSIEVFKLVHLLPFKQQRLLIRWNITFFVELPVESFISTCTCMTLEEAVFCFACLCEECEGLDTESECDAFMCGWPVAVRL